MKGKENLLIKILKETVLQAKLLKESFVECSSAMLLFSAIILLMCLPVKGVEKSINVSCAVYAVTVTIIIVRNMVVFNIDGTAKKLRSKTKNK